MSVVNDYNNKHSGVKTFAYFSRQLRLRNIFLDEYQFNPIKVLIHISGYFIL